LSKPRNAAASPARYLALGDSYTVGEGVSTRESFPYQLHARLRQAGIALQEPYVLAMSGWTSAELAAAIQATALPGIYELVSLLVGVNNQYRGLDLESYRVEFRGLLQQSVAFAGGQSQRVVVLSIPDWGQTPFGRSRDPLTIARQIAAFNRVNRAEAIAAGTRYVEITSLEPQADWNAGDGLHPSSKQYAAWLERILPEALAVFKEK
jgi:lysophospholipase L1-like esterase